MRDATESIWNNRTWGENVTVYFKDQKKIRNMQNRSLFFQLKVILILHNFR